MGNWNINIRGTGAHHNTGSNPTDANRMAAAFVQQLKDAGHTVTGASICYGEEDLIDHGAVYLQALDEQSKIG